MEENNLRPIIPSPLPEHDAMAGGLVTDVTWANSASSALTADTSKDFSLHNASSILGPSTVWTDEKHSLYLHSLEASFVNQLRHSIALRGCLKKNLWGPYSSQTPKTNRCSSSHQFMVLREGSWQKSNSGRNKAILETTADSHFIQKNPWIHHFASVGKQHIAACHDREQCASSTKRIHESSSPVCCGSTIYSQHPECGLCHHNSVGSAIEVSDQNFVDEDEGEKSGSIAAVKRLKLVELDASSNDQVIPFPSSEMNNVSSFLRKRRIGASSNYC
ncbi:cold-regulated protein 27 [Manihot esculenta]|uniref:Cold regulated protein 27 n=2 Tax=Manihot esculenta TaxID=3983 RepID=A0A2C9V479_MANES|nr:cold-regulated protein 27 [Manihot esculenta]KAG8645645.1 hypothetical protein MANES_10G080100v8 [Manihot esculenta]OAY39257.1 hypothetical protein MANES_10G080100v8 [Manihot esculenta]